MVDPKPVLRFNQRNLYVQPPFTDQPGDKPEPFLCGQRERLQIEVPCQGFFDYLFPMFLAGADRFNVFPRENRGGGDPTLPARLDVLAEASAGRNRESSGEVPRGPPIEHTLAQTGDVE